jgi:regulator of sigma E protease
MGDVINWLYVIVAVVLLFGAAVFVHEFGHYWVARRRGLKVEAFAIGFGPKILSWTKDGIEYSWRWIPAGGFVKLPQMITSEAIEGGNDADRPPLPPAHPWSKILVAFAGPLMNVVFAFAIAGVIYVVGLPVAVNPPIIGYVDPASPEAALGIQEGDVITQVNGKTVRSWEDVQMATVLARTNVIPVAIKRQEVEQTHLLTAKVNELVGLKVLNLDPRDHPLVARVEPGSPAEKSGLKADDVFLTFADVPIFSQEQLVDLIRKRGGQPSEFQVQRGTEKLVLSVTPLVDPTTKRGRIGVMLTSSSKMVYQVQKPGPTPIQQVVEVWDMMVSTISALFHSRETGVGAKDLSGPVGILTVLAVQVNTDYRLALKFLVLLNINLAVLNLLPIPVLDGGHIMMSLVEWIRRRPLSVRFVEYTTTAFAVLLISFMLYVTFFDLKRFSVFRMMFKRDTQIEKVEPAPGEAAPQTAPSR